MTTSKPLYVSTILTNAQHFHQVHELNWSLKIVTSMFPKKSLLKVTNNHYLLSATYLPSEEVEVLQTGH
jgi:hypothetical protein